MASSRSALFLAGICMLILPLYYYYVRQSHIMLLQTKLDEMLEPSAAYNLKIQQNLTVKPMSGYLINGGVWGQLPLRFVPYEEPVDLRIIVLTFNRSASLRKCLEGINSANYQGATVSLHVWIDRDPSTGRIDADTDRVAQDFNFRFGSRFVHHQPRHVGILGQWLNSWRPLMASSIETTTRSQERAVFIEDDLTVSPYFWRWLKDAHRTYDSRVDISGYGLSHPGISHAQGETLLVPTNNSVFLYRVICTWGFSPRAASWRDFQRWFYAEGTDPSFAPLVPGILPSQWFLGERAKGREKSLWEMWHIYYTHSQTPPQFTVILNSQYEGLLAVNRHELGLHDTGRHREPWEFILTDWKQKYVDFPQNPVKYNYDGYEIINNNYTYQYGTDT